jgi:hypothetical protein
LDLDSIKDLCVLHSCDNPPCHNPDHLFLGTHQDNADDKMAKGRWRGGDCKGEKNSNSKLTWKKVEEIRARYIPGVVTQAVLAKEYGVSVPQISYIVNNKKWKTKEAI